MNRKANVQILLGALVLFGVSAVFGLRPPLPHEAEAQPSKEIKEDRHDEHEEERVRLTPEEMREFGVELSQAGPGKLKIHVNLPGEIALNADRLVHVVPRVPGIVSEVRKTLGDRVRKGETMAVLESRDLADAKATFLAVRERLLLAEANFRREEGLWEKKITAEQEFLQAKQALAEARIESKLAEQKLHALGFSEDYLARLPSAPDASYTRYEITAPLDGTVIGKHIVLGEVLKDDSEAFIIADLSTVWVDISVYQKDLPLIREGIPVVIAAGHGVDDAEGAISYIGPMVGETTRTAVARVVLPNPKGHWRPGMFITAAVMVESVEVPILVSKGALQSHENETVVFVETEEGLEAHPVKIGRENQSHAEITDGLSKGQRYVSKGAFTLKAQLTKGAFGDGHGH
jgi:membrane fusion protein, heavy metal efflux system